MATDTTRVDELIAEARKPPTMDEALECIRKAVSIETYRELAGPAPGLEHVRDRFALLEGLLAELVAVGRTDRLTPERRRTILTALTPPWSRAALGWYRNSLKKWLIVPEKELVRVEKCLAQAGGKDVEDRRLRAALGIIAELSDASQRELEKIRKQDPENKTLHIMPITDLCHSAHRWAEKIAREHMSAAWLPEGMTAILGGSYSVLEAVYRALSLVHISSFSPNTLQQDYVWVDCRRECALMEFLLIDDIQLHPAVRHLARPRTEVEFDREFWSSVSQRLDIVMWTIEHVPKFSADVKEQPTGAQPGTQETCSACGGKGRITCVRCNGCGSTVMTSSGPVGVVSWNNTCPTCSGTGTDVCHSCQGRCVVKSRRVGEQCRKCKGTGDVDCESVYCLGRGAYWQGSFYVPCSMCNGHGRMRCDECHGAGHYV